ncbi:hypothetical protein PM082_022544 [Marasmius tenuissimus]|nr:hypothetical protein PM082_022544 [Marasmius tenuissimus]
MIKSGRHYPSMVVCIDDYDSPWREIRRQPVFRRAQGQKFEDQYCGFLQRFSIWNRGVVPLVVFAGVTNIFPSFRTGFRGLLDLIYELRDESVNMRGFNKQDVRSIAERLNEDFPSLRLGGVAEEYLNSEKGKLDWEYDGQYFGLPAVKVLRYFHDALEKAQAAQAELVCSGCR